MRLFAAEINQQIDEVEVEALPTDLPDKFEADVSVLKSLEAAVTIGDLKVGKNDEITDIPVRNKIEIQQNEEQ